MDTDTEHPADPSLGRTPPPRAAAGPTPATARRARSSPPARSPGRSSSSSGWCRCSRARASTSRGIRSACSRSATADGCRSRTSSSRACSCSPSPSARAAASAADPAGCGHPCCSACTASASCSAARSRPTPRSGFPIGTPDGYPTEWTFHGGVHAFAAPLAFLALVAVTFVVARRLYVGGTSDRGRLVAGDRRRLPAALHPVRARDERAPVRGRRPRLRLDHGLCDLAAARAPDHGLSRRPIPASFIERMPRASGGGERMPRGIRFAHAPRHQGSSTCGRRARTFATASGKQASSTSVAETSLP